MRLGRVGLWRVAVLSVLLAAAVSASAQMPDAARGQALYENHCRVCHTSQVHSRINKIPISRAELREIVERWQVQQKLGWSKQEVDDVVDFLNRTRYQFP